MKVISTLILTLVMTLFAVTTAQAAPFAPNYANPNVVAYYSDPLSDHKIVGLGPLYLGQDLVMARGNSGNFHQWFYGTFPSDYTTTGGIHSVWNVAKDDSCANGWYYVENAYENDWGDYMIPGVDFCVHNNYFHVSK